MPRSPSRIPPDSDDLQHPLAPHLRASAGQVVSSRERFNPMPNSTTSGAPYGRSVRWASSTADAPAGPSANRSRPVCARPSQRARDSRVDSAGLSVKAERSSGYELRRKMPEASVRPSSGRPHSRA